MFDFPYNVAKIAVALALALSSCQKPANESSSTEYPHPNSSTGGMTNVPAATLKSVSKAVDANAATVLTLGKTTVTIPAGAINVAATASLTSYGGVFINNATLTLESEPLLFKIIDMGGDDLTRAHIVDDITVDIESAGKVTASKLALLFHENGGLATAAKTGIKQSSLSPMLTETIGGRYKVTFKIRPPRIAMVLATTGGSLPIGYSDFVKPPVDVSSLNATVDSPSQITLTWQADATADNSFAIVTTSGASTPGACQTSDAVTATLNSGTGVYSYVLTSLTDATSYSFRVCGTSFRDPADISTGVNITAATPARAAVVLSNAPAVKSNLTALDVTVGGTGVVDYRYALLTNAANCNSATYSSYIPIATHITDTLPASGTMILCVLGRISSSNEQLIPTSSTWIIDLTAPIFTSISLANDATDAQIGNSEKTNNTAIVGALSASGQDGVNYAVATSATTCNASLTYAAAVPTSTTLATLSDGSYKVCVQLYDIAGNLSYGGSSNFTVDYTAPVFTSLTLTGDAIDGYINNSEKTLTNALTLAATGTGVTTTKYALTSNATTCNGALTYSTTIPKSNDAAMSADGVYKVCAQLTDAAGNATYGASNSITRKTTSPTFTNIAAGADVADTYLSIAETSLTNPLAGSVAGANYDTATYAAVTSDTTCNVSVTYGAMPNDNSTEITTNNQTYKICVKLTDNAGNTPAYGASPTFKALISNPTCTSVPLSGDAADSFINATEYTHATAITTGTSGNSATVITKNYAVIDSAATCDGAQTFSASASKANDSSFGVSGTYNICARVADAVSQYGYCSSTTITSTQNTIAFTSINLSGPAADGYINTADRGSSTAIVSGLVGLNYTTAKYAVVSSTTTCDVSVTYAPATPGADDINIAADGTTYKICVELSDNAENTPAYGASSNFVYDNSAPVFTSLPLANTAIDSYVNASEHSLTSELATPLTASGYAADQYALVTASTTCGLPLAWVSSLPKANDSGLTLDGSHKICVQLADASGNTTYDQTANFEFDATAPVFTSLSLANDASDGFLNSTDVTSPSAVAGSLISTGESTTRYVLATLGGSCSAQVGWSSSIPVGTDFASLNGIYKICVELVDTAGNVTYDASPNVTVDRTAPLFTSVSLTGDASDGYINANEHTQTNDLTGSASGLGYDTVQYALVPSGTSCAGVVTWSTSIPKSNGADFNSDGDYIVCVVMTDGAGNTPSYGSSSTMTLDTSPPSFTSLALTGDANDSALNQSERSNATSIIGALVASGQSLANYKVVTSSTTCDGALTYQADEASNTSSISGDGTYKICTKLVDTAGNIAFGSSANLSVDSAAPVFTSLALGAAVSDGYLNAAEHAASTSLGGTLTASGQVSNSYALVSNVTTCNASVSYAGMPNSDDAALAGTSTYKICVALTDTAGNTTYGASGHFVTDFALPAIASVTLAAAVSDSYLNLTDSEAATNLISSVSASNQDSISYAVITAATTCDGSVTFSTSIPKTDDAAFSGDGTWKICVKASDLAANTSAYQGSVTFTLDVTRPSSTVTTSGSINPDTTAGSTTAIAGTGSDAATGISGAVISIQEGSGQCYDDDAIDFSAACPHWISATGTTSWTMSLDDSSLLKGQTYTVSSKSTDLAGNSQTSYGSSSFTFTANEGANLWNRDITYDANNEDDRALAGTSDASGNLYVVGYHSNGDKNWLIKKFSKRGFEDTINWNKDVGDAGVDEVARSVASDSSGNVYVVGSRYNGVDLDWMIKKYSSSGVEDTSNWDMLIDSGHGDDESLGVTTDTAGNVYVVGYGRNIAGASSGDDLWIKKFSSAGVLSCEQKLDEGGANLGDRLTTVAINNATAKVYIAGYKTVAGPDQQLVVKRLRTSDCTVESTATANSSGVGDYSTSIKIDGSGNVLVAGVNSASGQDWWVRKYSSALALSSEFNPATGSLRLPLGLAIDSANRIYVGGYKTNANQDTWLRQFNSSLTENVGSWNQVTDGASDADQTAAVVISTGTNNADQIYTIGWSTNKVAGSSGADWWIKKLAGP